MRTMTKLLALIALALLVPFAARAAAPDETGGSPNTAYYSEQTSPINATGCGVLDGYRDTVLHAFSENISKATIQFVNGLDADHPGTAGQQIRAGADFSALAEALVLIDPPTIADDYHRDLIAGVAIVGEFMTAAGTIGITGAAIVYGERVNRIADNMDRSGAALTAQCPGWVDVTSI